MDNKERARKMALDIAARNGLEFDVVLIDTIQVAILEVEKRGEEGMREKAAKLVEMAECKCEYNVNSDHEKSCEFVYPENSIRALPIGE